MRHDEPQNDNQALRSTDVARASYATYRGIGPRRSARKATAAGLGAACTCHASPSSRPGPGVVRSGHDAFGDLVGRGRQLLALVGPLGLERAPEPKTNGC